MKAVFTVTLAAFLTLLATPDAAPAQTTRTTSPDSRSTKAADKAPAKKMVRSASGAVRAASNEAVVVVGRDKGREVEWTFAVEPTTNIRKGPRSIVAGDLRAGDAVKVRFSERDGRAIAESIVVSSGKRAPATKR